jgi:hypothetical protein
MDTPTLKKDRYDRILREHAVLLSDIDTLFSENPGTTAAKLRALMLRGGRPAFQLFLEAVIPEFSRGLRRLLHLKESVSPADVTTKFESHIKTTDGAAWWASLRPKLEQLHGLAWAA